MGTIDPELIPTAGGFLIGYLLNWFLFGALCVQVYIYYISFPGDPLWCKGFVYSIFLIETFQSIAMIRDCYDTFVTGFGDEEVLFQEHLLWITLPIVGGLVAAMVQIFCACRIYIFSKSKVLTGIICFLVVVEFAGAILSCVAARTVGNSVKTLDTVLNHLGHGLYDLTAAVCDVVIACCMVYCLLKTETNVRRTRNIVARIIKFTVGTGVLTAACAIVDNALYMSANGTGYWLTPGIILAKMYSNSMMVNFNSRMKVNGGRWTDAEGGIFQFNSVVVISSKGVGGVVSGKRSQTQASSVSFEGQHCGKDTLGSELESGYELTTSLKLPDVEGRGEI